MQVCTEQMVQDIRIVENRLEQIEQHSICSVTREVTITVEDHKNLASDLAKLDWALYWTDLKGSLSVKPILKCSIIIIIKSINEKRSKNCLS